ncbi:hypothetical protein GCM10010377_76300 [Streptomyces viridiviolaceus]|uniref:Transposase n=1 Tax=Streptomyces viridiviolaceus TaxID=68282 RepID=A0ABW2DZJ2_9ACTN|nr:hypothetical protein [Streptomyces viridiviolaceus]GHB74562.1 hypothetical protein GCM10010377_76300 [Streptomyces viridiviolaceus]
MLRAHELGAIGGLGLDDGVDNPVVITGYKAARTKPLTSAKKQVNKLIASARSANTPSPTLKNWRILTKLRLHIRHATTLLRPVRPDEPRSHPVCPGTVKSVESGSVTCGD